MRRRPRRRTASWRSSTTPTRTQTTRRSRRPSSSRSVPRDPPHALPPAVIHHRPSSPACWPGEAYARVQRFHDNGEEDDDGEYFGPSDEDLQDLFEMLIGGMLSGQLGGGRASMFGPGGRAGVLP